MQPEDDHVVVNGLMLHYRAWGDEHAPPVLILHGLTGHAWEFDALASALANEFRVVVLNQRGHGASAGAAHYSPELMMSDIARVIEALALGRVRLVGHSMGGVNGWWVAAHYSDRVERLAIIDIDPSVLTSDNAVDMWADALSAYAAARYPTREAAVASYLITRTDNADGELRQFAINNLTQDEDGQWKWRFDADRLIRWMEHAATDEEAHWSALQQLQCPTLVVRGGASPFTSTAEAERMVRAIPQARLVEIPNAGHDVHIDQRSALLEVLNPFLRAPG